MMDDVLRTKATLNEHGYDSINHHRLVEKDSTDAENDEDMKFKPYCNANLSCYVAVVFILLFQLPVP
jgi:hypothetical protein